MVAGLSPRVTQHTGAAVQQLRWTADVRCRPLRQLLSAALHHPQHLRAEPPAGAAAARLPVLRGHEG